MTNISNEITTYNCDFVVGDMVVINSPLQFVDRSFDSDELFTVEAALNSGITISIDGKQVTAAATELRHATIAEVNAKRRITKSEQALAEVP